MKSKVKQMLSVILTVCMLATVVPLNAYAADADFVDSDTTDVTVESDEVVGTDETADVDISEEDTEEDSDISVETESEDTDTETDAAEADQQEEELFTADEATDEFSAETTESVMDCYALTGAQAPVLTDSFFKIVFVDCGRKYFSVDSLKKIIDNAAGAGFNYVELGVGNDGLRFLLDDMSLSVNGTDYSSKQVSDAIHTGNEEYYNFDTDELTEAEMNSIIEYASGKGIGIIPMVNTPGHMDAILSAATSLTGVNCAYNRSARTIDVTNATAVAFTQALVQKYIDYFAGKGCKLFNMGADEYANDIYTSGSMGFGNLQSTGKYSYYVDYVNKMADMIKAAGMTPMAFNDGIYFNNDTSTEFDNSIVVCYWSSGWGTYTPMSAKNLSDKGFRMINTHGDYYWVLGGSSQCDANKAYGFNYKSFQGGTIDNPLGAMFCIWCDYPGAGTESAVVSKTAATIAAFGSTLPASEVTPTPAESETTPTPPANDVIETEKRAFKVVIGGTVSDTIENVNYAGTYTTEDENIATVKVTGVDKVESTVGYGDKINKSIGELAQKTSWTDTGYYIQVGENYYPLYAKYETTRYGGYRKTTYYWRYSTDGGVSYTSESSTRSNTEITVYTRTETPGTPASTTVTFTGVNVGTTKVTIGNVEYTITVTAEDLSAAILPVEYWITNRRVTANGAEERSISAAEGNVNSENGVAFSELVPEEGTQEGNTVDFWKGTRLLKGNEQTKGSGVDKTKSGDDFTYVRYWEHKWSFSNNGTDWTDFNSDDQVVAYYLQVTDVTDEITTKVVDWGVVPHTDYKDSKFVLVDYAVKYQSGLRTPDSFPVSGKTQAFHCDYENDTTSVHQDTAGNYYRTIGMIRAEETADYEVYMITLTPSSDSVTDKVASRCDYATSYEYKGTEKVIWVDNTEDLGDFTDESLHHADFSVGGEPVVDHLNIYNQQGMLVTYYIRTKQTEDSLTVNYIDDNANYNFYNYNIAVKKDTYFNEQIGLADPWKGPLANGDVVNNLGKTETVSADLKTMPQISGRYLYSKYTCVRVERSADGKTVNLYYTFENTIKFVIDYGLPIVIKREDIGTETAGGWAESTVSGAKFGTAELNRDDGTLTYTPTQVLTNIEHLQLTLKGKNANNEDYTVPFEIYIYPASTVYYEEGFASFSGGFTGGTKGNGTQATEDVTKHETAGNYGYDSNYDGNSAASSGQATSSNAYGAKATFTFTGTGVDIYANCTQNTSQAMVTVYSGDTLVKMFAVDTKIGAGTTDATKLQANLTDAYSVPIVSAQGLDYGEYTVNIAQMKNDSRTGLNFDGFRVYDPLPEANRTDYADSEKDPHYVELRNKVLAAIPNKSGSIYADKVSHDIIEQVYTASEQDKIVSAVVVDQNSNPNSAYTDSDLQDLLDNGSKNELYLYKNQSLIMELNNAAQIGLKGVDGIASYTLNGSEEKASTTDMFYPVSAGKITITNTSDVVLSITKLKACGGVSTESLFAPLTEESLTAALVGLGYEKAPAPTATPTVKPTQKPEQQIKLATPKLGKVVSAGYNALKLNWSKVKGADGYRVYVKVNGKWNALGNVKGTTYVHKNLETGKSYTFTVRAYKKTKSGTVLSSYDKKGITGKVTLSAPSLRKAKRTSTKKATLSWKKVDGANGYVVYRKTNNGRWQIVKKITKGSTTSFTDTKLSKGKKYTYTVRAYRTIGKKNVYSGYNKKGLTVK